MTAASCRMLIEAASSGDYENLTKILQPDPLKALAELGVTLQTLTATAASRSRPLVLQYCVELGANVSDYEVSKGVLQSNSLEVYRIVVRADDLNVEHGESFMTGRPLSSAILSNDVQLATYLLEYGVNIGELQERVYTPLSTATKKNNVKLIELLLKHGAPIDRSGTLLVAAENGNVEESALHKAVKGVHRDVIVLLVKHGADCNLKGAQGKTALDRAQELGADSIVRLLQGQEP